MTGKPLGIDEFAASLNAVEIGYWPTQPAAPHASVLGAPAVGAKTFVVKIDDTEDLCAGMRMYLGSLRIRVCGAPARESGVRCVRPPAHPGSHACGSLGWSQA